MQFFKHFTNANRGQSIQALMDELGHTGLCYWILVEMCAEKLSVKGEGALTELDCLFNFHPRIVRQNLRISSAKLERLLGVCQGNGLLSFQFSENSLQIAMPKLLECLDRESKRPRKFRGTPAEKARLDKEKDKDKEEEAPRVRALRALAPPPGYRQFENSLNQNRVEICRETVKILNEVVGRPIEPGFARRMSDVHEAYGWDTTALSAKIIDMQERFDRDQAPPDYREVALKKAFGLMREGP